MDTRGGELKELRTMSIPLLHFFLEATEDFRNVRKLEKIGGKVEQNYGRCEKLRSLGIRLRKNGEN